MIVLSESAKANLAKSFACSNPASMKWQETNEKGFLQCDGCPARCGTTRTIKNLGGQKINQSELAFTNQ